MTEPAPSEALFFPSVCVWVKEKAGQRWGGEREREKKRRLKSCFSLKNSALYYKLLKCFFSE
jgi:hypothetical protein